MYSTQDLVEMLGTQRKESIVGARGGVEEGSSLLNRDRPYVLAVTGTNLGNERGAFQSSHTGSSATATPRKHPRVCRRRRGKAKSL